jgi:hypothetical protein
MPFQAKATDHGTERGYQRHRYEARKARRNGDPNATVKACNPCKEAHAEHHRNTKDQVPAEVIVWVRRNGVLRGERKAA